MAILGRNQIAVSWNRVGGGFEPAGLRSISVAFLTERAPREVWIEWYGDPAESRLLNETLLDQLQNGGEVGQEAADAVNAFTLSRMREDGFYRRIMPPIPIGDDELDRPVPSDGSPITLRDDDAPRSAPRATRGPQAVAERRAAAARQAARNENRAVECNRPVREVDAEDRAFRELDEAIADADWGTEVQ